MNLERANRTMAGCAVAVLYFKEWQQWSRQDQANSFVEICCSLDALEEDDRQAWGLTLVWMGRRVRERELLQAICVTCHKPWSVVKAESATLTFACASCGRELTLHADDTESLQRLAGAFVDLHVGGADREQVLERLAADGISETQWAEEETQFRHSLGIGEQSEPKG